MPENRHAWVTMEPLAFTDLVAEPEEKPTTICSVAGRLRDALGARTVQWLQQELEAAGIEGSKYSNVQRYVAGNGKSAPPLEWLQGAAEALGVRVEWLAFGTGGRHGTVGGGSDAIEAVRRDLVALASSIAALEPIRRMD